MNELRTWAALRLARDIGACEALLCGEAVDPSRVDPDALEFLRGLRLVRLDFRAIDLLDRRARLLRLMRDTNPGRIAA